MEGTITRPESDTSETEEKLTTAEQHTARENKEGSLERVAY